MTNDYQKLVHVKNRLLDELNARRKDRVDQLKKSGTTFLSIVAAFRERELREEQGKHIELVRLAKEKKKSEWRKPNLMPDGSKDCLLMDEHSEFIQEDSGAVVRSTPCVIINKYYEDKLPKKILLVENAIRRVQFFQQAFKNHKLDIASNPEKALNYLKDNTYDLICLDFDVGLDQDSTPVAEFLKNKNIYSEILIHSMNKNGAEKLRIILSDNNRHIEIYPFEDILKNNGEFICQE